MTRDTDKQREYARSWYQKNREKVLARLRDNKEANAARSKAYYQRNPHRVTANHMANKARRRAERDGSPFDRQVIQTDFLAWWLRNTPLCQCCGRAFNIGAKNGRIGPQIDSPTLDRIAPSKGYVWGNVALLCWRCNRLKSDASADELEAIANWMRRHG